MTNNQNCELEFKYTISHSPVKKKERKNVMDFIIWNEWKFDDASPVLYDI